MTVSGSLVQVKGVQRSFPGVDDTTGAVLVDGIDAAALADYAGVCGLLLAKGHT